MCAANMTGLTQVAAEVSGFCNDFEAQRERERREIDFCNQMFDFAMCSGELELVEDNLEARSKSDVVSMPGLTSGTSEDGGCSPLPPPEDRARARARLDDAKKQDDELTIPRRELRPKGQPQYPPYLHVFGGAEDAVANMADDSRESSSNDGIWSSSSGGNSPFTEASSPEASKPDRGRRNGPLMDREAVAEVRELGACVRCRIRKLKASHYLANGLVSVPG